MVVGSTFTTTVKVVVAPTARAPTFQTNGFGPVVWAGEAEEKVTPAGSVSVTTTLTASVGPALVMVNV